MNDDLARLLDRLYISEVASRAKGAFLTTAGGLILSLGLSTIAPADSNAQGFPTARGSGTQTARAGVPTNLRPAKFLCNPDVVGALPANLGQGYWGACDKPPKPKSPSCEVKGDNLGNIGAWLTQYENFTIVGMGGNLNDNVQRLYNEIPTSRMTGANAVGHIVKPNDYKALEKGDAVKASRLTKEMKKYMAQGGNGASGYFYAVVPTGEGHYDLVNITRVGKSKLEKVLKTDGAYVVHMFNKNDAVELVRALCHTGIDAKVVDAPEDFASQKDLDNLSGKVGRQGARLGRVERDLRNKADKDDVALPLVNTVMLGYIYTNDGHLLSVSYDRRIGDFYIGGRAYVGFKGASQSSTQVKAGASNPNSPAGLQSTVDELATNHSGVVDSYGAQVILGAKLYEDADGFRLDLLTGHGVLAVRGVQYDTLTKLMSPDGMKEFDRELRPGRYDSDLGTVDPNQANGDHKIRYMGTVELRFAFDNVVLDLITGVTAGPGHVGPVGGVNIGGTWGGDNERK